MKTKFSVGDEARYKGNVFVVLAVNAYWWGDGELVSYKLEGVNSWVFEQLLDVVI